MSSTVTSLLCLGLCLGQKITAAQGTIPRPSIRAEPSSMIPREAEVTFCCKGPQGSKSVRLWKDEESLLQMNDSRPEAEFNFRGIWEGNVSCQYLQEAHQSELSAPLQVAVTGFFAKPSFQVQRDTTVALGEKVTFVCLALWAHNVKLIFFLLRVGMPAPLQWQSPEGMVANYILPSVKTEHAGKYSCIYSLKEGKRRTSEISEILRLEVTASDYTTGNIIHLSLAGLVLLILGLLLGEGWNSQRDS